jgi:hypothetical protein
MIGAWMIFSDQIHMAESFQRSLVMWPSSAPMP